MLHKAKLPNGKDCVVLDVVPTLDRKSYTIYDITLYFKRYNRKEYKQCLGRVAFTIKGKHLDVLIIDWYEQLTDDTAKQLAIYYVTKGHEEKYDLQD